MQQNFMLTSQATHTFHPTTRSIAHHNNHHHHHLAAAVAGLNFQHQFS